MISVANDGEFSSLTSGKSQPSSKTSERAGPVSLPRGIGSLAPLPAPRFLGGFTRTVVRPYGIALLLVAAALVSTLVVRGWFPYPFLFLFFAAVMASAWLGGTPSGLFAVFLSTVAVAYFFVPPFYSFAINATDTSYFVAFVLCSLVASWVSSSKKKSEQALRDARDQLEARVAERTAELRQSNTELLGSIHARNNAQQALMKTQAELAHLSRVLTMGELTSSIAHEVNQPLTAVVTYGHACLEWLSADPPNLSEAREVAARIIQDGTRAGAVLGRIRSLFKKEAPANDWLDMNEVIRELTIFLQGEAMRQGIVFRTELFPNLPRIMGDRVPLQQVVLNLTLNGMEAMSGKTGRPKELVIRSQEEGDTGIRVIVEDSGIGLSPEIAEQIFHSFFSTKAEGIGMGLSISRSIVESHAGRLWAEARPSGGATFQFIVPIGS
jgi:C4-dicarboxylate-specific signal transduction histidine kinase